MSNTAAPPPTAPPPTAEAFVFTAPGTLREIVSQQNTAMKDLADQVARQGIALKQMQAKMDAQELAHNDEMDAQAQAQNAKIATLSAQVVDVNRRWMQSCEKINALSMEVAMNVALG